MNDAVTEVMDNAVADVTNAVGDAVPTDVTEKIGFVERYLNELPQKALNLGIRVVLALVFFFVGVQVIKLIRRIVKKSLKRANADLGVIQFLDSLIKAILYMILLFRVSLSADDSALSYLLVPKYKHSNICSCMQLSVYVVLQMFSFNICSASL